jgi:hypothetical protein
MCNLIAGHSERAETGEGDDTQVSICAWKKIKVNPWKKKDT